MTYGSHLPPEVRDYMVELVGSVSADFGGGSGAVKALALADLIVTRGIRDTVEIGVYRGRSLLPVAAMLKLVGAGRAIGIDPWSAEEAMQHDDHEAGEAVREFAANHPWEETYKGVVQAIEMLELGEHCELRRMSSEAAAPGIADGSVGLVHIDGNHDRAAVERDVELYVPKLTRGGFLVLDDASWASVRPLVEDLRSRLEPVLQVFDGIPLYEAGNDFIIFRVP